MLRVIGVALVPVDLVDLFISGTVDAYSVPGSLCSACDLVLDSGVDVVEIAADGLRSTAVEFPTSPLRTHGYHQ